MLSIYLSGMAAAFVSGLISIGIMMKIVKKAKLGYFALYCLIMGIISIVWF
jgi:undecaprenyl-diphosphatase